MPDRIEETNIHRPIASTADHRVSALALDPVLAFDLQPVNFGFGASVLLEEADESLRGQNSNKMQSFMHPLMSAGKLMSRPPPPCDPAKELLDHIADLALA